MTNWYFLINTSANNLAEIRAELFYKHAVSTNNQNEFSENISLDGETRLIKVAGIDSAWISSQSWISDQSKCAWAYPQTNDPEYEGTIQVVRWTQAQDPEIDNSADENELPDTPEQRRSWWMFWR